MTTATGNDPLERLATIINTQLPGHHRALLTPALDAAIDTAKRRKRILELVQEAMSQLRVDMKYLMFDLEATRRERDEYKQKLEK